MKPVFWEILLSKKLKISSKKQIPWNGGSFNVSTPDKVAETKKNVLMKLRKIEKEMVEQEFLRNMSSSTSTNGTSENYFSLFMLSRLFPLKCEFTCSIFFLNRKYLLELIKRRSKICQKNISGEDCQIWTNEKHFQKL